MFPLAIIAASMLAKYMASQDAADRQSSLQRSMQQYQQSKAQENEKAINNLVQQQTPDARSKELQNIQQSRDTTMQQTVDQAKAASPVTAAAGTNTSKDYQDASAAAADRVSQRTARAIQQLGVMGSPGEQGVASGLRFGRAAGQVDAGNGAINNVGAGYMRDINNVRPDPMLTMLGDAGLAVGSGMAFGGGGGAQPNLLSPSSTDWGSLDAGPGAYNANMEPSIGAKMNGAIGKLKASVKGAPKNVLGFSFGDE